MFISLLTIAVIFFTWHYHTRNGPIGIPFNIFGTLCAMGALNALFSGELGALLGLIVVAFILYALAPVFGEKPMD
ncbi:multisubunit Na+/H+ antiporter MnhG subunit [Evansella vedderi]|uniref:Multisubunit Na+/H+ antiporter MnhG subunit n=1 Tax=Evansella vedderi TaxID=38282 RepID=A0ABT9ZZD8_9BACI|nr:hypothetical protein [Evansella vedderi]MDQ0255460.1 multisubunit Na+/H+ antiporter MnhG subunit [Evansella vedderi]